MFYCSGNGFAEKTIPQSVRNTVSQLGCHRNGFHRCRQSREGGGNIQRPWIEALKALGTSHQRHQRGGGGGGEPTSEQEDQLPQTDRPSAFVVDCVKFSSHRI